jgi:K+-sensing histidine kinase KdpD
LPLSGACYLAVTATDAGPVQFIRNAGEDLKDFVNAPRDLARVGARETVATLSTVTVSSMFGAPGRKLRRRLVSDAVASMFNDATDIRVLHPDQGRISPILCNCTTNAIEFTGHGKPSVWETARPERTQTAAAFTYATPASA